MRSLTRPPRSCLRDRSLTHRMTARHAARMPIHVARLAAAPRTADRIRHGARARPGGALPARRTARRGGRRRRCRRRLVRDHRPALGTAAAAVGGQTDRDRRRRAADRPAVRTGSARGAARGSAYVRWHSSPAGCWRARRAIRRRCGQAGRSGSVWLWRRLLFARSLTVKAPDPCGLRWPGLTLAAALHVAGAPPIMDATGPGAGTGGFGDVRAAAHAGTGGAAGRCRRRARSPAWP